MKYIDRDGSEMTEAEYKSKSDKYHEVRHTTLRRGDCYGVLMTDWIGKDLSDGKAPHPLVFGSAFLHHGDVQPVALYGNLHSAKYGHKIKLMELRAQGWNHGWRAFPGTFRDALRKPRSLKAAWLNVAIWGVLTVMQLGPFVGSLLTGMGYSWFATPVQIVFGGINAWCLWHSLVGVGTVVRKRAAERQAEEDKAKFETIIGNQEWSSDSQD